MVGEFVNDAKRVVEDSWPWRALLDTVSIPTVAGTSSYDLEDYNCGTSGTPPRENARLYIDPESSVPLIRITTDNQESLVLKASQSYLFIERQTASNDNIRDRPNTVFFGTNPSPTTGNSNLRLFPVPIPDAVYALQVYLINPQNNLSVDSTVILAPSHPIVQLAYLYCLYERGEEVGESLSLTSEKANMALADAIMHDQALTSDIVFRNN
jgi:hypothetical protein